MIQIKILNHDEAARSQGGLKGLIGVGLSRVGLMDLRMKVEEQVAKQILDELTVKGVKAEVAVFEEATTPVSETKPRE